MIPTISGVYRSPRFEMSLSVPSFLAQYNMMAIGKSDANISEITSRTMNLDKSNPSGVNDNVRQIIANNGMVIIGGFVIVEILSAIFSLFPIVISIMNF